MNEENGDDVLFREKGFILVATPGWRYWNSWIFHNGCDDITFLYENIAYYRNSFVLCLSKKCDKCNTSIPDNVYCVWALHNEKSLAKYYSRSLDPYSK